MTQVSLIILAYFRFNFFWPYCNFLLLLNRCQPATAKKFREVPLPPFSSGFQGKRAKSANSAASQISSDCYTTPPIPNPKPQSSKGRPTTSCSTSTKSNVKTTGTAAPVSNLSLPLLHLQYSPKVPSRPVGRSQSYILTLPCQTASACLWTSERCWRS